MSSEGPRDTTLPGFTPNFLVFGREKKAPIDLVLGPVTEDFAYQQKAETYVEFVEQQIGIYQESYQIARARWDMHPFAVQRDRATPDHGVEGQRRRVEGPRDVTLPYRGTARRHQFACI